VSSVYADCADFPQTVEAVYRDGHQCFVEVGPNAHRAAAVDSILAGRPHIAVAMDKQGKSAFDQMNRMLAVLVTNGLPGIAPGVRRCCCRHASDAAPVARRCCIPRRLRRRPPRTRCSAL
jgi:hypothetical protein